jgi:hypothetical protein
MSTTDHRIAEKIKNQFQTFDKSGTKTSSNKKFLSKNSIKKKSLTAYSFD